MISITLFHDISSRQMIKFELGGIAPSVLVTSFPICLKPSAKSKFDYKGLRGLSKVGKIIKKEEGLNEIVLLSC